MKILSRQSFSHLTRGLLQKTQLSSLILFAIFWGEPLIILVVGVAVFWVSIGEMLLLVLTTTMYGKGHQVLNDIRSQMWKEIMLKTHKNLCKSIECVFEAFSMAIIANSKSFYKD